MIAACVRCGVAAILTFAACATTAQTIYRCGQTYSRVPCPGARAIEVEARTTAAQRAEARRVAQSEKRLADEMVRDRRAAEAALHPALATSLGPAKVVAAAPAPVKKAAKKKRKATTPDDGREFIAIAPKAKKAPS
jgi:hypothetical protein